MNEHFGRIWRHIQEEKEIEEHGISEEKKIGLTLIIS